jgi:hypothetical protein
MTLTEWYGSVMRMAVAETSIEQFREQYENIACPPWS